MNRRRGTGKVINLIYLEQYWLNHIVTNKFEVMIVQQLEDVHAPAGEKIVQAEDIVAIGQ
jgi:hypothetical protein